MQTVSCAFQIATPPSAEERVPTELPLKALVWQDQAGKTWISYNDPVWIASRFGLPAAAVQIADKMRQGL